MFQANQGSILRSSLIKKKEGRRVTEFPPPLDEDESMWILLTGSQMSIRLSTGSYTGEPRGDIWHPSPNAVMDVQSTGQRGKGSI